MRRRDSGVLKRDAVMYALTCASRSAHKIVEILTSSFDVRENFIQDTKGMNVFHVALQNEDCDMKLIMFLVREYTRHYDKSLLMNQRTRKNKGIRPIHFAVTRGDMELIDYLVSVGAIGIDDEEKNENLNLREFNRKRTKLIFLTTGANRDLKQQVGDTNSNGVGYDWDV